MPFWKKFLSYFGHVRIEQVESKYSGLLEVTYSQGRYALRTQNAIYSFEDLYRNFRESFYQIPLDALPINKVLVLGLGLGSVPLMLEKLFQKNYHYTCVEIDEQVIALAQKYGIASLRSPIEILCADAYQYVAQSKNRFDLIIVDLFIDSTVPSAFNQRLFSENLKNLLTDSGLLLFNRMASNPKEEKETEEFHLKVFSKVFPNASQITVGGNKILTNRPWK